MNVSLDRVHAIAVAIAELERSLDQAVRDALDGGESRAGVARALGRDRTTLYRRYLSDQGGQGSASADPGGTP